MSSTRNKSKTPANLHYMNIEARLRHTAKRDATSQEHIELVSACCGAPVEEIDGTIARCSDCGEMSPVVEV